MEHALLTLSVSPALEEELVDWFLETRSSGFTTWHAQGVGGNPEEMSLAEQVAGRQRRLIFKLHGPPDTLKACLAKLKKDYPNADIHFWLHPLLDAGNLKTM